MLALQKTPYRNFIVLQVLLNTSDDLIQSGFQRRRLMVPSFDDLAELRKDIFDQASENVRSFYDDQAGYVDLEEAPESVLAFFRKMGLGDFLKYPQAYSAAKDIFDQPDLRTLLYTHIIAERSEIEIRETLESITKYSVDPKAIILFKNIFCVRGDMDYKSWKEWVYALRKISYLEADLYTLSFSNRYPFDLVKWKLHAKLEPQDIDKMMENFVTFLYYKSMEAMEGSAAEEFEIVQGWLERFMKAYDKHKTLGKGKHLDSNTPVEEALFYLDRKTVNRRTVLDLGEDVSKVQGPILLADVVKSSD